PSPPRPAPRPPPPRPHPPAPRSPDRSTAAPAPSASRREPSPAPTSPPDAGSRNRQQRLHPRRQVRPEGVNAVTDQADQRDLDRQVHRPRLPDPRRDRPPGAIANIVSQDLPRVVH